MNVRLAVSSVPLPAERRAVWMAAAEAVLALLSMVMVAQEGTPVLFFVQEAEDDERGMFVFDGRQGGTAVDV